MSEYRSLTEEEYDELARDQQYRLDDLCGPNRLLAEVKVIKVLPHQTLQLKILSIIQKGEYRNEKTGDIITKSIFKLLLKK